MSNPRPSAICKHGNEISLLPSFNYVRCAKCDAETDAEKQSSAQALPPDTKLREMIEDRIHFILQEPHVTVLHAARRIADAILALPALREPAAQATETVTREDVIEECARKVRYDCAACGGDGYDNGHECEYCGRPMQAIRALKQS